MKQKIISALFVIVLLVMMIPIPAVAQGGPDIHFEVEGVDPNGALIRAEVSNLASGTPIQAVVLNLQDLRAGILPQNCRYQAIKAIDVQEVSVSQVRQQVPVYETVEQTIDDLVAPENDPVLAADLATYKASNSTKKVKDAKKDIKDKKLTDTEKLVKFLEKQDDLIRKETSKKTVTKQQVLKATDKFQAKLSQGGVFAYPGDTSTVWLDFYVDTGVFEDVSGFGTDGVLALIINGQYYYDDSNSSWWDASWGYRNVLSFNAASISENLTDFPVKVELTSSTFDFSLCRYDGGDIRFMDSDDSTSLEYEFEKWDYENEEAILWVKVPQINQSSAYTDYIYIYYGNATASTTADPEKVFGDYETLALCESTDDWSASTGGTISLDSTLSPPEGTNAIKNTVASPTATTEYTATYAPTGTWDLSDDSANLSFYLYSDRASTAYTSARMYAYEGSNYRYWNLTFSATTWVHFAKPAGSGDGESGTAPDMSAIDSVVINFKAADTTAFYYEVDWIESRTGAVGIWHMADPTCLYNADFSLGDAGWEKGAQWSISGGVASSDGSATSSISQAIGVLDGLDYEVTYTVSNYTSGTVRILLGGTGAGTLRSANGTYTEEITSGSDGGIYFQGDSTFIGSIDDISIEILSVPDSTRYSNDGAFLYNSGDVNISNCDTTDDWSGTVISLQTTDIQEGTGAIQDTNASPSASTLYTTTYDPSGTWDAGARQVDFWIKCDRASTAFTSTQLRITDDGAVTQDTAITWDAGVWKRIKVTINTGTLNEDAIDSVQLRITTADTIGYYLLIDHIYANGGPIWNSGGYLEFDGLNDYVDCGHDNSLNVTTGYTAKSWVTTETIVKSAQRIISKNNEGGGVNGDFILRIQTDDAMFYVNDGTPQLSYYSDIITADTWLSVVGLLSNGIIVPLINGVSGQTPGTVGSLLFSDSNVIIGGGVLLSEQFDGSIANISIENQPQSSEWLEADNMNRLDTLLFYGSTDPPPTVSTLAATNVDNKVWPEATLNGNLEGLGGAPAVEVWFEYTDGTNTDSTARVTKIATGTFSADISEFIPDINQYRACAENVDGIAYGSWVSINGASPSWWSVYKVSLTLVFLAVMGMLGWFGYRGYRERNVFQSVFAIVLAGCAMVLMLFLLDVASGIFST